MAEGGMPIDRAITATAHPASFHRTRRSAGGFHLPGCMGRFSIPEHRPHRPEDQDLAAGPGRLA
jgi:hypothetical protein